MDSKVEAGITLPRDRAMLRYKRPASITAIAALLILYDGFVGASLVGLIHIPSLKDQNTDLTYVAVIAFGSLLNVICGIGFLCGKSWGRIAFFCLQPVVFLLGLFYQVREISNPAFMPEVHFYNNLLAILWESLRPIAFFGACIYFLNRPSARAFFQKSPKAVNSSSDRNSEVRLSSPSERPSFSYLRTLLQLATFRGRASIAEFWIFYCINFAICIIPFLGIMAWYSNVLSSRGQDSPDFGPVPFLLLLPLPILTLAVAVRRLHDSGKSGWWLLLALLPGAGAVIVFVLLLLPGEGRTNQYGPAPSLGQDIR